MKVWVKKPRLSNLNWDTSSIDAKLVNPYAEAYAFLHNIALYAFQMKLPIIGTNDDRNDIVAFVKISLYETFRPNLNEL